MILDLPNLTLINELSVVQRFRLDLVHFSDLKLFSPAAEDILVRLCWLCSSHGFQKGRLMPKCVTHNIIEQLVGFSPEMLMLLMVSEIGILAK